MRVSHVRLPKSRGGPKLGGYLLPPDAASNRAKHAEPQGTFLQVGTPGLLLLTYHLTSAPRRRYE